MYEVLYPDKSFIFLFDMRNFIISIAGENFLNQNYIDFLFTWDIAIESQIYLF